MHKMTVPIFLLIGFSLVATAQEAVKRLYINNPEPSSTKNENFDQSKTLPLQPALSQQPSSKRDESATPDVDKLLKNGPLTVLSHPKFKEFVEILTDKKIIATLNQMVKKDKLKVMLIGQVLLILISILLRSWVASEAQGFLSRFLTNTWIAGLHIFLALIVLPRFIYGPNYFDLLSRIYKFITAST